jgi:UDP-glucose 4-epimerase
MTSTCLHNWVCVPSVVPDLVNVSLDLLIDGEQAHVLGLEYLLKRGDSTVFNLGNGSGFSVREVIETAKEVTGKEIKIVECDRRHYRALQITSITAHSKPLYFKTAFHALRSQLS